MKVYRKTYKRKGKQFSGTLIVGSAKVEVPEEANLGEHMSRAFYLTACLEAPTWGTIQSYDGCGISGGPMHWVAVLPKGSQQGPLFKLLRRLEQEATAQQDSVDTSALTHLWGALAEVGWYVARDGVLRSLKTGVTIKGSAIREKFTPNKGNPGGRGTRQWKQAERWASLFYNLLSAPWTFAAQEDHSIEYLIRGARTEELRAYRYFMPQLESPEKLTVDTGYVEAYFDSDLVIPMPVDFAMCVYHSFSPNAPGMARVVLGRFFKKYDGWLRKGYSFNLAGVTNAHRVQKLDPNGEVFAQKLIKQLGTTQYGNWHDRPHQSGSRYDRCRKYARASGLWPAAYFVDGGLMPEDLKKR